MSEADEGAEAERIYATVRAALIELFALNPARITREARLVDDLEIDSIDAVDLVEHVRRTTGHKLSAEDFRAVRTVSDLVSAVQRLLRSPAR